MYGFFTFFHIIGFIVWLGLLITLAILLPTFKDNLDSAVIQKIIRKIIYTFNTMTHLAAIIVLITGTYRISQINLEGALKPFWLNYMAIVGWCVASIGIIFMEFLGRSITVPLSSNISVAQLSVVRNRLSTYIITIVLIMLAVISIILVVSFKL